LEELDPLAIHHTTATAINTLNNEGAAPMIVTALVENTSISFD
jgi:hypothetical protein